MAAGEHRLIIATDWQGVALREEEVATVDVRLNPTEIVVEIDAPYDADPPPPGAPGPTEGLWQYEVVELFLAGADVSNAPTRYLEIEVSPHGHYLVLTFEGIRQRVGSHTAVECSTQIGNNRWQGAIRLDSGLASPRPLRANAYRLSGTASERRYLSAYPVPGGTPDFHRLDQFRALGEETS